MAQHDYDIANQSGSAFRADLNNALAAIVSNNSGASAPSTTYAHQIWIDSSTSPATIKRRDASNVSWITLGTVDGGIPAGTAAAPSLFFTNSTTGLYLPNTNQLAVATAGTQRLVVDASGNINIDSNGVYYDKANKRLAIGTSSPSQKLEVQGSAVLFGNGTSDVDVIMGISGYGSRFEYSTGKLFLRTNNNNRLVVDNSGNVGIGTASPQAALTVIGSTSYIGATNVSARFSDNVTSNFAIGHPSAGGIDLVGNNGLNFCTSDGTTKSERARIDSSGRLLIGTITATQSSGGTSYTPRFVVYAGNEAGFYSRVSTSGAANVINNEIGSGTRYLLSFDCGATRTGDITSNGTTTSYGTTSDYRLKENVAAVTDGISRLQQLKPSRFNFIADPGKTVDGFIAHEVQAVVPEAITGDKDAVNDDGNPIYQGIDQSKLVPLLTAALQEAVAEINALKDRVAALEAQ